MKKLKNVSVFLLAAALLSSAFTGCSGNDKKAEAAPAAASSAASTQAGTPDKKPADDPFKDHMEISIAMWDIGEAIDNSKPDAVREKVYKDLNITLKPMNVTWDDYQQKYQVWSVSDQLPDMFATDLFGTSNYRKWIDQGLLHVLPENLSQYPEIEKLFNSPGFEVYKYPIGDPNGKRYSIPRLNHTSIDDWSCDTGVVVRKDWMEKVGITKEPETMDEFITLMTAFVNNDCNGNGKKDEVGLTMYSSGWLSWFALGYEPGLNSGYWSKDPSNPERWIPSFMTPKALEYMKKMKQLYDAGGLDKDFPNLKGEEGRDKFVSSTAGAYSHDITPSSLSTCKRQFDKMPQNKGKNFEDVITVLKPFKHEDGNYYRMIASPAWSETYINAKCDDKKVDRIMRIMDYYVGKGYDMLHYGFEGKDWKKDGDKVVLTPQKDSEGKDIALKVPYPFTQTAYLVEWGGTRQWTCPTTNPALQKMSSDMNDWLQSNAKPIPTDLLVNNLDVPSKEKATGNSGDYLVKCILSKDIDKTWNTIIKEYMANGYEKYIDEVNAKCKELGIRPK